MRNLMILPLISLILMGCQTPPPVYSTTYYFYDFPDCTPGSKDCRPTSSTKTKTTPKPPPPPKVEKASEFTGGGRALQPGEW